MVRGGKWLRSRKVSRGAKRKYELPQRTTTDSKRKEVQKRNHTTTDWLRHVKVGLGRMESGPAIYPGIFNFRPVQFLLLVSFGISHIAVEIIHLVLI